MHHWQSSLPLTSIVVPQSFVYDVQKRVLTALLFYGTCRLKYGLSDIFFAPFRSLPSLTMHLVLHHNAG